MKRTFDVARSFLASGATLARGMRVGALGTRPAQLVELWDFETCPHSRRVREALSMLDLDARIWPCPKGGTRFRPELATRAPGSRIPSLVDPNVGATLSGADDIIRHLYREYGDGQVPITLARPLGLAGGVVAAAARVGAPGAFVIASRAPAQPLDLWSFEASPYCRIVREALTSLELPYVLHNVAKGSPKRAAFVARSGRQLVPWLSDPNTGTSMFESADIVEYLLREYGA